MPGPRCQKFALPGICCHRVSLASHLQRRCRPLGSELANSFRKSKGAVSGLSNGDSRARGSDILIVPLSSRRSNWKVILEPGSILDQASRRSSLDRIWIELGSCLDRASINDAKNSPCLVFAATLFPWRATSSAGVGLWGQNWQPLLAFCHFIGRCTN